MKRILLTGANGYIGKRLLPSLLKKHHVICCVRDKARFQSPMVDHPNCEVIQVDFLKAETLDNIPDDIDAAYFLMHSMSSNSSDFSNMERRIAQNFRARLEHTKVDQVIYLSGINNDYKNTSKHLSSREKVAEILKKGTFNTTILGAGIIVGSGSASFEIMRDLVEKLPVMLAPKWLLTKSQFIAVSNVVEFLDKVLFYKPSYNHQFDICGPQTMNYKEMLMAFSKARKLKRWIIKIPWLSPRLSSLWLYFVTATSFNLARSLVDSMKVEIIGKPNTLHEELDITLLNFEDAVKAAFRKIEQNDILSSWKDSAISGRLTVPIGKFINVPTYGCFSDQRKRTVRSVEDSHRKIWSIGGTTGWYYGSWLWGIRGFLDKILGGVGLRRGRTNPDTISAGDALDFWRVILAEEKGSRLLLYAEMRLPGEAWLEFKIDDDHTLIQTATFRPRGVMGRIYWFAVLPFHSLIFNGMATRLAK